MEECDSIMKKAYIKSQGCNSNLYDSYRAMDLLEHHGYKLVDSYSEAHLIVINTCNIREKAAEKMYSDLGRYNDRKKEAAKEGEDVIIVVMGCVGQAEGSMIRDRAPYVDLVLGSQVYHMLPEMLERLKREKAQEGLTPYRVNTDFPVDPKFDFLPKIKARDIGSACVAIQEGCDKFCTFCCVPYTRGPEYSRPVSVLVEEVKELASQGIKEILLQGQNVSAYHGVGLHGVGTYTLAQLCLTIAEIPEIQRIRYMSSHPRDMTQELADVHKSCSKMMPALHLPVQSGSNSVLKKMNRGHTRERYLEIIDMFLSACPEMKFSSDFIVGFPGETEQDFQDTLDLVEKVQFTRSYSYAYSQRPGTPASIDALQVPENVKKERLYMLQSVLDRHELQFNASMMGRVVPVLFSKEGRKEGQILGNSLYLQSVSVSGSTSLLGEILPVTVNRVGGHGIGGEIVR